MNITFTVQLSAKRKEINYCAAPAKWFWHSPGCRASVIHTVHGKTGKVPILHPCQHKYEHCWELKATLNHHNHSWDIVGVLLCPIIEYWSNHKRVWSEPNWQQTRRSDNVMQVFWVLHSTSRIVNNLSQSCCRSKAVSTWANRTSH